MNTIGIDKLESDVLKQKLYTSFREYILSEAKQVGYIYHFTTLSKIEQIFKSKKIKKGNQGYVSLTRDFQLPNESGYFSTGEYIVRITIDGDKLSENVKLHPHRDEKYNDEREEGVINDINEKYFHRIDFLTSDNRIFSNTAVEAVYNQIKKVYKETYYTKKWTPVKG